jgi:hypothetical protein
MLDQIFISQPYTFQPTEDNQSFLGVFALPNPLPDSPDTLYLLINLVNDYTFTHKSSRFYAFDPVTGADITAKAAAAVDAGGVSLFFPDVFFSATAVQSRLGQLYWNVQSGSQENGLYTFDMGSLLPATLGGAADIPASRFFGSGDVFPNLGSISIPAIDETANILLAATDSNILTTFNLTTGASIFSFLLPGSILSISLYLNNQVFVLIENGFLVNLDFVHNKVLGCVRIPNILNPTDPAAYPGFNAFGDPIMIYWYARLSRLLIVVGTPDVGGPGGINTICIRGYLARPIPVRVTPPIPLTSPKVGREVPVLVQILDEANFPVSSGQVVLTSADTTVAQPISFAFPDTYGNTEVEVEGISVNTTGLTATLTYVDPVTGTV